jgi:hypothetical protein
MRLNSKVAIIISAAVLVLGMSAAAAVAAVGGTQQWVALDLAGSKLTPQQRVEYYSLDASGTPTGTPIPIHMAVGAYGDEITLQPTVLSAVPELPNDVFHFQILVPNDVDASGTPVGAMWKDLSAELDIKVEDTNTVQPITYLLGIDDQVVLGDGTLWTPIYPYTLRCEYKPGGSSTTTGTAYSPFEGSKSYSETETVALLKNHSTRVTFSVGSVKHAGTHMHFRVSPNCGPGTVRVTVTKHGSKTLTYNLATDAEGLADATLKLGTVNGTYKVSAKFLGNTYGVASPTASKNVHANR